MSQNELVSKVQQLNEWEELMEEARAEAEALRDAIKAEMLARDTEKASAILQTHLDVAQKNVLFILKNQASPPLDL